LISVTIVHDINLALNFADEILLMKNGKTVKQVSVEEITESDINDVFEIRAKIIDCDGKKAVVFGG
ncbi:ABC transporter ATP-binding protein, partial [Xanthomonas citri pv. citri]|nr:ABC transporter ATP-binding protein [Xanthomonas citri pv. citri]